MALLKYKKLQKARAQLIEEIQAETPGVPISAVHLQVVEMRMANAIAAGVNITDIADGVDPVPKKQNG